MGLTGALYIGRSALTASQLGIQVAGNNMANAATPGYSRQRALFSPTTGGRDISGSFVGRGVSVSAVNRQVNEAIQARLRTGVSTEAGALARLQVYSGVESTLNELTGFDLSSQLNTFFSTWSERANLVQSSAVVVQQGQQFASFLNQMRADLSDQRELIDDQIANAVNRADAILNQVAQLNGQISSAEVGQAQANGLRDQRDTLLQELGELMDVSVVEHSGGQVDVLVGSTPVILGGVSRGLDLRARTTTDGSLEVDVITRDGGATLGVRTGQIGGLLETRENAVDSTIETLDELASRLIFEMNKLHSTGANPDGLSSATAGVSLQPGDEALALNDPANASINDLPFQPVNGGFLVRVTNQATGATQTVRIDVDLDGIDNTGAQGFGDDTSLDDIIASLDAITGLNASLTPDGKLRVSAADGYDFSFSEDTSGVLAVLEVNSFFTGRNANEIAVRDDLLADPTGLSTGRFDSQGKFIENGTALGIAQLLDSEQAGLSNRSFREFWTDEVQTVANRTATALSQAESAGLVRQSLEAQRAALSGVSIDEEAIDLLTYQRQFQGAARLISVVQELTNELVSLL